MYKYFVPDEPENIAPPTPVHSRGDIVPIYDEQGGSIPYIVFSFQL